MRAVIEGVLATLREAGASLHRSIVWTARILVVLAALAWAAELTR